VLGTNVLGYVAQLSSAVLRSWGPDRLCGFSPRRSAPHALEPVVESGPERDPSRSGGD
jgi:hypothetical protein